MNPTAAAPTPIRSPGGSPTSAVAVHVGAATPAMLNRRQLLLLVCGFVITFLLVDRILSRTPLVPVYGSRNGSLWKWELFQRLPRTPDVVFLGASFEMCGIHPSVVDDAVSARLGRDVYSLNLASSSCSLLTQALMARRIVESGRRPKVLYFGVSPPAMDDTLTHWMADGVRSLGVVNDAGTLFNAPGTVQLEGVRAGLFASYCRWDDFRLAARLTALGAPLNPERKLIVDDRGWARWNGGINLPPVAQESARISNGAEPGPDRGVLAGATPDENAIRGFEPGNVNDRALRESVDMLRRVGVEVRLVELPHHSISRPRANPATNRAYQQWVAALAGRLDVSLVRSPPGLIDDSDFFDEWHLHPEGAEKFSVWLAEDVAEALRSAEAVPTDAVSMALPAEKRLERTTTCASRRPQSTEEFRR